MKAGLAVVSSHVAFGQQPYTLLLLPLFILLRLLQLPLLEMMMLLYLRVRFDSNPLTFSDIYAAYVFH